MRPERADYLGAVDALAAVVAASSSASQRAFSADLRAQRVVEPGIVKVGIAFTTIRSRHLCRLISKKFANRLGSVQEVVIDRRDALLCCRVMVFSKCECGEAGSVNIVPNWHDRAGQAVPFTRHWKTMILALKLTADRPFADPEKAARRLLEHARAFEPIQDGRIYIEKLNGPFLFATRPRPRNTPPALSLRYLGAG